MSTIRLIDSHAHLDFAEFDADRDLLVADMKRANIDTCIIPGVSPEHWPRQLDIAHSYQWPFALGVHPWWAAEDWPGQVSQLRTQLYGLGGERRLVAIGECGLDKIRADNWQWQVPLLEAQLELAAELELPLILHCVKAHNELLSLLSRYKLPRKGVIHGFYGSVEIARRYIELGFKLGIGGLVLNGDASKLHKVVAELPIDSFICETDSPAMAPKSSHSRRNSPLIIVQIITKVADLQKKSDVLISERLLANVTQLFEL
ncbi:TatD family hydrolase [Shewanella sp. JM162201]|uniref:TatD family hydrolase n=1 Tax=Shewanella jiangmenensis TaxID=2837387 RepID=A0ABS5V333_9GAMM|nr:TatD family hydrolase [Shewanella jiangmenensis]MBT1443473.1 TatD family hydrolase [Shewanella jiangmenensis]